MPIGRRPTAISSPAKTGLGGGAKALFSPGDLKTITIPSVDGGAFDNTLKDNNITFTNNRLTAQSAQFTNGRYQNAFAPRINYSTLVNTVYIEFLLETSFTYSSIGLTNDANSMLSNAVMAGNTGLYSIGLLGQSNDLKLRRNGSVVFNYGVNRVLMAGDYVGISFSSTRWSFYLNGVGLSFFGYTNFITDSGFYYPVVSLYGDQNGNFDRVTLNTGTTAFKYQPAGTVGLGNLAYPLVVSATSFNKTIKSITDYDIRPKVEEVFSTDLIIYGNTRATVVNNLNLLYRNGLVLENVIDGGYNWTISSSLRGSNRSLANNTGAEITGSGITFNQNGFSTVSYSSTQYSSRGIAYTFIANPYFFNTITWSGTGTSNRPLQHGLNIPTGMIVGKPISDSGTTYDWYVWHRSITHMPYFNSSAAGSATRFILNGTDLTNFVVQGNANVNGQIHEAFIFGHDTSPTGLIQCGIFSSEGANAKGTINHGWAEGVQFIIHKRVMGSGSIAGGNWFVYDTVRNVGFTGPDLYNILNGANPETASTADGYNNISDSNGVLTIANTGSGASDYIYVIIRAKSNTTNTVIPLVSTSQSSVWAGGEGYRATLTSLRNINNSDQIIIATAPETNPFIQVNLAQSTFVNFLNLGTPNPQYAGNPYNISYANGANVQFSNDGGATFTTIYTTAGLVASSNGNLVKHVIPIGRNCTNLRLFKPFSDAIAISQLYLT